MLNKRTLIIGISGLVVLAVVGLLAFNRLTTNNTAPSALTAIRVIVNTAAPGTSASQPAGTSAAASGLTVYQIVPEQSKVSFTISEDLNGSPNTVVGTTSLVAGQVALNPQDLSQTQVGAIQVDARGLATDSNRRNGAIRNFILNSDQYEYITFTCKSITGLTGAGQASQPYTFQMTGDLKIRDVPQSVTFDVTAQGTSLTQISGTAKATVNRSDYNLTIPSVPNVANVGEQVALQIDFAATSAG